MKLQFLTVLAVVVGAYALPRTNDGVVIAESSNEPIQRSIVEIQIRNGIEMISRIIQRIGLDPVEVEKSEIKIDPKILDVVIFAFVENLKFNGISNIRIHTLNYNHIFNRLRLDVSLPEINLSIDDSGLEARVFGREFEGQLKGSLSIKSIRLNGELHVDVGIGGFRVRSLSVDFSLGGIESDLTFVVQEEDLSETVNHILGERIPFFFEDNKDDINRFLETFIVEILNYIWSTL